MFELLSTPGFSDIAHKNYLYNIEGMASAQNGSSWYVYSTSNQGEPLEAQDYNASKSFVLS